MKFVQDKKNTWESYLDTCIYAFNTSRHESSSFELMFGRKAVIPVDLDNGSECTQPDAEEIIQKSFRRYRKTQRRGWRRQKRTSSVLNRSRRCMIECGQKDGGVKLTREEVNLVKNGHIMLKDRHIDAANQMLRKQFPEIRGLHSPFLGQSSL